MVRRSVLALSAGLTTALAYEPVDWWPLLLIGVCAGIAAVHGSTVRQGLVVGLCYGAGFMGLHLLWMRSVGWDAWVLIALLELAFFAPMMAAWAFVMRLAAWPVWLTVWWVVVEQWRTHWPFGGMPWGRLAHASVETPFASLLPYLGSVGVSGFIVAVCATVMWFVLGYFSGRRDLHRQAWALAGASALAVMVLGANLWPWVGETDGERQVAAVQGDVPGPGTNILYDHMQVSRNHFDETQRLAQEVRAGDEPAPDFVVWPENSTAVDPFANTELKAGIENSVREVDAPILVGAIVDATSPNQVLNQGIVWRPGLGAGERYTKRHPVPFGEYIPGRDINPLTSRFERFAQISRDMIAGTRSAPLSIADTLVADSICFDVAYDDGIFDQIRGGAQMLVVQTSNATYIKTEQTDQQFEITRARALETGRWTVVAATNGVAGIIAPDGTVVERLPKQEPGHASAMVTLTSDIPPSITLAPIASWASVLLAVLSLALGFGRRRVAAKQALIGQDIPVNEGTSAP